MKFDRIRVSATTALEGTETETRLVPAYPDEPIDETFVEYRRKLKGFDVLIVVVTSPNGWKKPYYFAAKPRTKEAGRFRVGHSEWREQAFESWPSLVNALARERAETDEDMVVIEAGNHEWFRRDAALPEPIRATKEDWTVKTIEHRDSGCLTRANAKVIFREFKGFSEGTIFFAEYRHWGVGWVVHAFIRVRNKRGRITRAFRKWLEIERRLDRYPILDEGLYSEMEYNEAVEFLQNVYGMEVRDDAPEDWIGMVINFLNDMPQHVGNENVMEALAYLDLLPEDK